MCGAVWSGLSSVRFGWAGSFVRLGQGCARGPLYSMVWVACEGRHLYRS